MSAAGSTTSQAGALSLLEALRARLENAMLDAEYREMWGIRLNLNADHAPTTVVLQKLLRANARAGGGDKGVVEAAAAQLTKALVWRRKTQPARLLDESVFSKEKFARVGYVTSHGESSDVPVVITWNRYGMIESTKATFGDAEEFIQWRVALMELGVRRLNLDRATEPLPHDGEDPYQIVQVHDYAGASFFTMDSDVRTTTKQTIETMQLAYPELLKVKYLINVPAVLSFACSALRRVVPERTMRKVHAIRTGRNLAQQPALLAVAELLPPQYGGEGMFLVQQGEQTKMGSTIAVDEAMGRLSLSVIEDEEGSHLTVIRQLGFETGTGGEGAGGSGGGIAAADGKDVVGVAGEDQQDTVDEPATQVESGAATITAVVEKVAKPEEAK